MELPEVRAFSFKVLLCLTITALPVCSSSAQQDSITVSAGMQYGLDWFSELFVGSHWRNVWTQPVKVPVLDLDTFADGLTPIEKGGGKQTLSLRLKGNDGYLWKFRTINKDPSKILPLELRDSWAADVIQDQISSSHPYASVTLKPLLDAVGVMQADPAVYYLPDDEKLGVFREEFGNQLGTIEIHPKDEDYLKQFEGAEDIESTYDLFKRLEKKRDEKIDAVSFLKARLIDVLVGDWDRHADQWKWAKYEYGNLEIWKPIPRDRDQAYASFDGLFPAIATFYENQLCDFGYSFPTVRDITWHGKHADSRILPMLTKAEWDSVTAVVYNSITDEVIEKAMKQLPPEVYDMTHKKVVPKLKERRDRLIEFSNDYYEYINKIFEVYCTDKKDYVQVTRLDDELTHVAVYDRVGDTYEYEGEPLFSKICENSVTDEIRIFMLKDDDLAVVRGDVDCSPTIRIAGGEGADELIDSSVVDGWFLCFTPIPDAEDKVIFYDPGGSTEISYGPGTVYDNYRYPEPETEEELYEPAQVERGGKWRLYPYGTINSDDGILVGVIPNFTKYHFKMLPYDFRISAGFYYASKPESYRIKLKGIFNSFFRNSAVVLETDYNRMRFVRYYGFGNQTSFDMTRYDTSFYRLNQEAITADFGLRHHISENTDLLTGVTFESAHTTLKSEGLMNTFRYPGYGLDVFRFLSLNIRLSYDSRDNIALPYKGMYFTAGFSFYPEVLSCEESFMQFDYDLRGYVDLDIVSEGTLAFRSGGELSWEKYPFYKAAFLGGSDNLRGYVKDRFAGDASVFFQTEYRAHLTRLKLLITGDMGFYTFGETGRVFTNSGNSTRWHSSYGGGLFISYLNRLVVLSAGAAFSDEFIYLSAATSIAF